MKEIINIFLYLLLVSNFFCFFFGRIYFNNSMPYHVCLFLVLSNLVFFSNYYFFPVISWDLLFLFHSLISVLSFLSSFDSFYSTIDSIFFHNLCLFLQKYSFTGLLCILARFSCVSQFLVVSYYSLLFLQYITMGLNAIQFCSS